MKKIILGVVLLVVIVTFSAGAYLFFNIEKLATAYKPTLEKMASDALGADVKLGSINVSVFPSTRIEFNSLNINNKGQTGDGLQLHNLVLDIDTMAIFSKTLAIETLELTRPAIRVIKQNGKTWLDGLPQGNNKAGATSSKAKKKSVKKPAETANTSAALPLKVNLKALAIKAGQILYDDLDSKKSYTLSNFDLDSSILFSSGEVKLPDTTISTDFQNKMPIEVELKNTSYDMKSKKLQIEQQLIEIANNKIVQKVKYNLEKQGGAINTSTNNFKLEPLIKELSSLTLISPMDLSGQIEAELATKLASNQAPSINGHIDMSGLSFRKRNIEISDGKGKINLQKNGTVNQLQAPAISFNSHGEPVKIAANIEMDQNEAKIEKLAIDAFNGNLFIQGVSKAKAPNDFNIGLKGQSLLIASVLKAAGNQASKTIEGTMDSISARVTGRLSPDLKSSLSGQGQFKIVQGRILGTNIAGATLKALKLPFIEQDLYKMIPSEFRDYFNAEDTVIEELSAEWSLASKTLNASRYYLKSSFYSVQGKGTCGFNGELSLSSKLTFSADFSEKFVAKTKEAKYMLDENGQIVIPLLIKGVAPRLILVPDTEEILKLQAGKAVQDKAGKVIDKLLGDKSGKSSEQLKKIFGF